MLNNKAIISIFFATLGWCLSSSSALAAYFAPMSGHTKSDWNDTLGKGGFIEEFNVSSYIGDGGGAFYELEINDIIPPDTIKTSTQEQFLWERGQEVQFELSLDDTGLLTYKVGGETLMSQNVIDSVDINGIMLSANSTENSDVTLTDLKFGDGSESMEDLFAEGSNFDMLKITGINESFTFSGTQIFTWDEGTEPPRDLELGYKIQVGKFQQEVASANLQREIPEPTTISFFSLLAVAAGIKARKK